MGHNLFLIVILLFVGQTLGSLIGLTRKPKGIILYASLAVAAGFMTYISIEELIPAAKIRENSKIGAASLALGAVCALAISF